MLFIHLPGRITLVLEGAAAGREWLYICIEPPAGGGPAGAVVWDTVGANAPGGAASEPVAAGGAIPL